MTIPADVRAVARALCAPHDPDALVYVGAPRFVEANAYVPCGEARPFWELKVLDAEKALAGIDALFAASR